MFYLPSLPLSPWRVKPHSLSGWSSGQGCRSSRGDMWCPLWSWDLHQLDCTLRKHAGIGISPLGTGKSHTEPGLGAGWAQQNRRVCLTHSPLASLRCLSAGGIHLELWPMMDFSFARSDAQLITVISVVTGEVLNICSELSCWIGDCELFTSECFCKQKQEKCF